MLISTFKEDTLNRKNDLKKQAKIMIWDSFDAISNRQYQIHLCNICSGCQCAYKIFLGYSVLFLAIHNSCANCVDVAYSELVSLLASRFCTDFSLSLSLSLSSWTFLLSLSLSDCVSLSNCEMIRTTKCCFDLILVCLWVMYYTSHVYTLTYMCIFVFIHTVSRACVSVCVYAFAVVVGLVFFLNFLL